MERGSSRCPDQSGQGAISIGNLDKCRGTLNDALKLMPNSEPLHVLSARVAIEQGQPEFAERELEVARQLAPADSEPYYLSGVVYQRWQKLETAYDFYGQAAVRSPAELVLRAGAVRDACGPGPDERCIASAAGTRHLFRAQRNYSRCRRSVADAAGSFCRSCLRCSAKQASSPKMNRGFTNGSRWPFTAPKNIAKPPTCSTGSCRSDQFSKRADLFLPPGGMPAADQPPARSKGELRNRIAARPLFCPCVAVPRPGGAGDGRSSSSRAGSDQIRFARSNRRRNTPPARICAAAARPPGRCA